MQLQPTYLKRLMVGSEAWHVRYAACHNPRDFMAKKRGTPNWGKPGMQAAPVVPTSFEEVVRKLRLSPADYEGSIQLKEWVRKNKDQKYIPDALLKIWGFEVKGDL